MLRPRSHLLSLLARGIELSDGIVRLTSLSLSRETHVHLLNPL